ncbi:MAG TPA: HAMP domain-containing sensor histidine kinase [Kofleriaceae bacterium]
MLHEFLQANRVELTARCRAKVAARSSPPPTPNELESGIPMLLDQLVELLRTEQPGQTSEPAAVRNNMERSATQHGGDLLRQGFTVDQVVHDYGDLCQAVTELAQENHEPISVGEFHTFNRCLDSAIADAVSEFGRQRDHAISAEGARTLNERLGSLAHELRNLLNTAMLASAAIKGGHGAMAGATGAVLDRSLAGLRDLIDRALADVRLTSGLQAQRDLTVLAVVLEEVTVAARLDAAARKLSFTVSVEPGLSVETDRQMLSSALANLLQNAFKFTRPGGHVSLTARVVAEHVLIEIADQCGGLPPGWAEELFAPFVQRSDDRTGLGLGLSISRRAVEASGGTLQVRDVPGTGCVFTIDLPLLS